MPFYGNLTRKAFQCACVRRGRFPVDFMWRPLSLFLSGVLQSVKIDLTPRGHISTKSSNLIGW